MSKCTYSGCAKIENKNKHGFEKPEYFLFPHFLGHNDLVILCTENK